MKAYKTLEAVSPLTLSAGSRIRTSSRDPVRNEYWDTKEPALHADVVSGKPLFARTDKFEGSTGCRSRPQSRLRSPSPISKEECREPLCCRCIRSCPIGR
jgi:peptide methionine sulfoxide reductase MsrB